MATHTIGHIEILMLWGWSFSALETLVKLTLWAAGILGVLAAVSAFVSGYVGYELADAIQRASDERVADAKGAAAAANEAAGRANASAAAANERAAILEKEAAVLRIAAAWRSITAEQYGVLKTSLSGQHFEVWTSWVGSDPEATQYRFQIDKALRDAGIKTKYFSGWERVAGLQITNVPGPERDALVAAFTDANIPFVLVDPSQQVYQSVMHQLAIVVGTKPPPF